MTNETVNPSGSESYLAKLSIKTMGCDPRKVATVESGKLPLGRIYGKAVDVKFTEGTDGKISCCFIGTFEGINMETGEVFRSGKLYMPGGVSEVMQTALTSAQAKDDKASISFAFEIRSVKAGNPIGYSYEAKAIKPPEVEDELAEIRKLLVGLPVNETVVKKYLTEGKGKK